MAQDPFAQDAWTRARNRFMEDLSESERNLYHQSSLEKIFYDASATQKRHQDSSNSRNFASKLQPFTAAIEQYGKALDVFVNAYPLALSPLWGSIRVVLLLASEFGKYFEKLIDMFERIGDILPRFRAYERLFPNNERLVQSLSVAYVDILKFCLDVKAVFRRGKRSLAINLKIFSKLVWKPFEMQFGGHLNKFREHKKTIEKEAELSHMIESAESRALILANRLQMETEKREQDRIQMLIQLSAVSHEDLHEIQRRAHHPGSGSWMLQTQEYIGWRSSTASVGLCCFGIPGSGKSVLVSTCVEDMLRREHESHIKVVFYYCSHADPRSTLKSQILGNLLRQMLLKGMLSAETEREILDAFVKSRRNPTDQVLTNYVFAAAQRCQDLYIVFDGLDECSNDTARAVSELLLRLIDCSQHGLHVLVTCREESHVMEAVRSWNLVRLEETVLRADMRSFITSSVRARIERGELKIRDSAFEDEIVQKLTDKAHGMFLWVHFQLVDLCASLSTTEIRQALDNLPEGLGETYQRILVSISRVSAKAKFARKVFRWLACAQRPLRIDELQEAVAFDESDEKWDAEKIPHADLLLQSCHSLVVRDLKNATIRFAHHTVYQYLLSVEEYPLAMAHKDEKAFIVESFKFNLKEAELEAALVCIAYLNFTDFETSIAPRSSSIQFHKSGILGPGGPGAIPSTLGIGKPIVDAMYRILGGRLRPTNLQVDFARHLNIQRKAEDPEIAEKYALKNYIVSYWPWHVDAAGYVGASTNKLINLITTKALPFEFRPWGPNKHFGPYGCTSCWIEEENDPNRMNLTMTSMIHWATEHGLCALISQLDDPQHVKGDTRSILEMHIRHEKYSNQSILTACRYGRTEVFRTLEKYQDFTNGFCFSDFWLTASASGHADMLRYLHKSCKRMLFEAATNGQVSVVRAILQSIWGPFDSRKGINYIQDDALPLSETHAFVMDRDELSGLTPLHSASVNGHHDVILLLAKHCADLDRRDVKEGASALHFAAKFGHTGAAMVLVSQGSFLLSENGSGDIPLVTATKHGQLEMVRLLLELQSKIHMDNLGLAEAIGTAAENGHLDILKELLAHSASISLVFDGMTPLYLASMNGHSMVVEHLLVKEMSSITTYHDPEHGYTALTPLIAAAKNGHTEVVDLLLRYDRNTHVLTDKRVAAASLARANGHDDTWKKLCNRDVRD